MSSDVLFDVIASIIAPDTGAVCRVRVTLKDERKKVASVVAVN